MFAVLWDTFVGQMPQESVGAVVLGGIGRRRAAFDPSDDPGLKCNPNTHANGQTVTHALWQRLQIGASDQCGTTVMEQSFEVAK
jgi:hypothetical protein